MNDLEQKILRNPPIENFLEEKFRSFGFEQLTNIQKKAIPTIYQKKNSLVIAPTFAIANSKSTAGFTAEYKTPPRATASTICER